ncbi:hypothetical protein H2198_004064 [Neophaeococcomyces mojaviensis]|uniref:Uncharacterized protein n=1 Tax=Neophaeococcomyces mojaviensis TaxID=3383035 RepID=A0ACC3A9P9_9EURO|nr:hypothetical protein H2198_004064 [Knufia sp. JES_112]
MKIVARNRKGRRSDRTGALPRLLDKTTISGNKPSAKRSREEDASTSKVVVADPKCTIQFNTGNTGDYVLQGFPSLEVSASHINSEDDVLRIVENQRKSALEVYNLTTTVMDIIELRFVRTDDTGVRSVESFDMAEFRKWRERLRNTGVHHLVPCSCATCTADDGTMPEAHAPCVVVVFDMLGMVKKLEEVLGVGVAEGAEEEEDEETVVGDGATGRLEEEEKKQIEIFSEEEEEDDDDDDDDDKERDPDFEL